MYSILSTQRCWLEEHHNMQYTVCAQENHHLRQLCCKENIHHCYIGLNVYHSHPASGIHEMVYGHLCNVDSPPHLLDSPLKLNEKQRTITKVGTYHGHSHSFIQLNWTHCEMCDKEFSIPDHKCFILGNVIASLHLLFEGHQISINMMHLISFQKVPTQSPD